MIIGGKPMNAVPMPVRRRLCSSNDLKSFAAYALGQTQTGSNDRAALLQVVNTWSPPRAQILIQADFASQATTSRPVAGWQRPLADKKKGQSDGVTMGRR